MTGLWILIGFFIIHWYGSLFFQTFFLHRYSAHQAFTMSKGWEKVFYVLTFIFQGSNYLSAYGYGVMHRMHHAYADTEQDPHSPKFSANLFEMMWGTKNRYAAINSREEKVDDQFTNDVPDWRSFDNFASNKIVRILWMVIYTMIYIRFVPEGMWYLYLLLPIHFGMAPIHGVIINWFAHIVGYRTFKAADTSTNLMPVDIFMMGEGYHNNHHVHGNRANFGYKWHEVDPTYIFIWIFDKVGIIKLSHQPPIKKELLIA